MLELEGVWNKVSGSGGSPASTTQGQRQRALSGSATCCGLYDEAGRKEVADTGTGTNITADIHNLPL